jgi:trans-2-enoyl-CoA reductase
MNNSLVVNGSLTKVRSDLDEATHALSNYLETKSDEEAVAWLQSAIEATVRAVSSVSLAVERLSELPVCDGGHNDE